MNVTVGIVEDDALLRKSLTKLVAYAKGMQCLAGCATGEEALQKLPQLRPQVVLMDLNLPQMPGTECIRRLKALLPETQVIVLTVYEDSEHIFQALKAGASGYLLKRAEPDEVLEAIRNAREGGAPMSSQIAYRVVRSFHEPVPKGLDTTALTEREKEILTLLSQGFANKELADKLQISVPTVRTHLRHIYEKLHVRSRSEAIVKYLK
ncbi:MAG TPA: response regulator transcription factor [Verrucomicrobiae bacterium]|jgi:DNA-binding NarL/FixJ family response regulator|nr:response regulator transcription factor [Verrucomicrobiae bacterium]